MPYQLSDHLAGLPFVVRLGRIGPPEREPRGVRESQPLQAGRIDRRSTFDTPVSIRLPPPALSTWVQLGVDTDSSPIHGTASSVPRGVAHGNSVPTAGSMTITSIDASRVTSTITI